MKSIFRWISSILFPYMKILMEEWRNEFPKEDKENVHKVVDAALANALEGVSREKYQLILDHKLSEEIYDQKAMTATLGEEVLHLGKSISRLSKENAELRDFCVSLKENFTLLSRRHNKLLDEHQQMTTTLSDAYNRLRVEVNGMRRNSADVKRNDSRMERARKKLLSESVKKVTDTQTITFED